MPIRIPWDRFEVALLFQAYEKIVKGADLNTEAVILSETLRRLAVQKGITIDDTYRNVNGMKMQFGNVQYLFTNGKKGLSAASPLIREMFRIYKYENNEYQAILRSAIRLTEKDMTVENAFFNYAKDRTKIKSEQIAAFLQKAADYCHLKLPLLGLTNIKTVRNVQQKVFEDKHLRFKYGKDAQAIRDATKLYYAFVKSYRKPKAKFTNDKNSNVEHPEIDNILAEGMDSSISAEDISVMKSTKPEGETAVKENMTSAKDNLLKTDTSLKGFREFLQKHRGLTERTAGNYCTSIRMIEEYIRINKLDCSLLNATTENVQSIVDFLMDRPDFLVINLKRHHQYSAAMGQYANYLRNDTDIHDSNSESEKDTESVLHYDERWLVILKDYFPDGYILNDFLSQFQAAGFWEERYGKTSPLSGSTIDEAMTALGNVRDGRVYVESDAAGKLFETICEQISEILNEFTAVYRSSIYERYASQLAEFSIYTEPVMTQQLMTYAKNRFYKTSSVFARQGKTISLNEDCRRILQNNGGPMSANEVSKELWFIPYDTVYHNLVIDEDVLNLGNGVWMLAENFPLTKEDAAKVGDMLDECFISRNFVTQAEVIPLLRQYLPSIADNLSGLHFIAVFNILNYYLKKRFSFSKAIIAPKGAKQDFCDLFRRFAKEHDQFTLEDISAFARDLNVSIYWENTYIGGAVRISGNEFINKKKIAFDIEKTDAVLESFCTGDYLPFQEVTTTMMMHLPTCGYQWNGYLLLSYVHGFSKSFRAYYNSLGKTGYYGAMVKQSCEGIKSYEDLVERVLTDEETWVTEDDALALLVKKGLQAQKRFKGIEQIAAKARQNIVLKGGELLAQI